MYIKAKARDTFDGYVLDLGNGIETHVYDDEALTLAWVPDELVINWISVRDQCPEEDDGEWLVTLKSGRVTFASYMADEDGDYWRCLDRDDADEFFCTDPVTHWAELPAPARRR